MIRRRLARALRVMLLHTDYWRVGARCDSRVGTGVRARRPFAARRGLFAEEFDARQRQLRGNVPQWFVHALVLDCATRLV